MKLSTGFWQTYKETPSDAEIPSHQLMIRAGLIHKSAAGIYNYLPIGYRVIRKVEQIVREEMDRAGCFEILMSVVTPGELWQETKRWEKMGGEMLKFKDKADRDLCISPTNEEAVTDIFRKTVKSYKNMPVTLYQINTKFRDEIRPRFGLMRGREFTMKDAYSFDLDKEGMDKSYQNLYQAYCAILERIGLNYSIVEADAGNMASAGAQTHEFQVLAGTGEDTLIVSEDGSYGANIEKAQTKRAELNLDKEVKELKKIETKNKSSIEDVCTFLNVPQSYALKSLVYEWIKGEESHFVLVLLLGDDQLNEVKLKNFLGADHVQACGEKALRDLGLVKGYIGPFHLPSNLTVFMDAQIDEDASFIVGAGEKDFHFQGFNPKRDLKDYKKVDLRLSKAGDLTLDGKIVKESRGIEVGHIFQLGDLYTKAMNASIQGPDGKPLYPMMGCYGIGVTRIVGAAIEQHHDDKGIIWPKAITPYQVYLAVIAKTDEVKNLGEEIYQKLISAGFEVILDDRNQGPGFKFKDAELLGIPLRVVLGERDFKSKGTLEIVERRSGEKVEVKPEELAARLTELWDKCQ